MSDSGRQSGIIEYISTVSSEVEMSHLPRVLRSQCHKTVSYHRIKSYLSDFRSELGVDPLDVAWVSPERIRRHTPTYFHRRRDFGQIRGGDWDRYNTRDSSKEWLGLPVEEHPLYEAMAARFEDGTDWLETQFVQRQIETVQSGEIAWYGKCHDRQSIHSQCQYLDQLYDSLKNNGYRRDKQDGSNVIFSDPYHEITVNIDREGELLFASDGRHRLFLSKILGIPEVPVRVLVVHRELVDTIPNIDSLGGLLNRVGRRVQTLSSADSSS